MKTAEWLLKITQAGASKASAEIKGLAASTKAATAAQDALTRAMSRPLPSRGGSTRIGFGSAAKPKATRAAGSTVRATRFQAPAQAAFAPALGPRGTVFGAPAPAAVRPAGRARSGTVMQRPHAAAFRSHGGGGGGIPKPPRVAGAGGSIGPGDLTGAGAAAGLGMAGGAATAATAAAAAATAAVAALSAKTGAWAVKTAEAKQNMFTSFEVMLKSQAKAQELMTGIEKFARDTPFTAGQVGNVMKSLVGAGYDAKTAFDIFKRIGDTSAFAGFDEKALEGVTRAIVQIKAKGKLSAEELNQIFEAAPGAVSRETLVSKLAQNMGKSTDEITKALEHGEIKSADGIRAILDTIDSTISGGKAGGLMEKLGSSITGRLSSLADLPSMLVGMSSELPGLEALRGALGSILEAFDSALGPLKSSVQSFINNVFGGLFGGLASAEGKDTLTKVFLGMAKAIDFVAKMVPIVTAFFGSMFRGLATGVPRLNAMGASISEAFDSPERIKAMTDAAVAFGEAVGTGMAALFGALATAQIGLSRVQGAILDFKSSSIFAFLELAAGAASSLSELPAKCAAIGAQCVLGLVNGIRSMLGLAAVASTELGATVTEAATTELKVQSPSRVFEEIGGHVASGMAIGVAGGAPGVHSAIGDMAGGAAGAGASVGLLPGSAGGGAGGGAAAGANLVFNYHIDATNLGDRAGGEAVAEKFEGFEAQLRAFCEQALAQMGAGGAGPAGA